ncbi:MAG: penicillin-binding protein 1B [Gammaproteobacteria bacterium]|nr:penicillin-binding protein 1B [Gammaproteobacteria bacterium]
MSQKKTRKKSAQRAGKKATAKNPSAATTRRSLSAGGRRKKKRASKQSSYKPATASTGGFKFLNSEFFKFWSLRLLITGFVVFLGFTAYLDIKIRKQFEGQKWALPAHVYTRPMEFYQGQNIDREVIRAELDELGYQAREDIDRVGSYRFTVDRIEIHQRKFRFWDVLQDQQKLLISLDQNRISAIRVTNADGSSFNTEIVRLEPRLFGSVSPLSHEDRSLLMLEDVPPALIDALIAIEDRQFYTHFGINPVGIARAMVKNLSAGRVVQGGSTLTQQLVKNYYLSADRTFKRKLTEMIMAVLLEMHYSKEEILQAYLNEVYLSQAGNRAIHGFALGSQAFFGRPLHELDLPELAMLAGIIKGPSYYNPIKNPLRAKERRDLVLKTMLEQGSIDQAQYAAGIATELKVNTAAEQAAPLSYPAFMGFVRENLQDDYHQEDLLNDGLQIHTTLNPRIQQTLERSTRDELNAIENRKGIESGTLQVAAVVIRTDNGEVAAMVGDRKSTYSGFNRALHARRPVGSLLKPFVYLTALEMPQSYSLATPVDDFAITVSQKGSPDWQPKNYDGEEHGPVMLIDALAHSYNLATVQLGMQLGVGRVGQTIRRLGYQRSFSELPSLLLGAVPMSVLDVGQLYLSLASGGFKTPIKGIRSVLSKEDEPLARYPLAIEQVVEPQFNNLIIYALQEVVRKGTARGVLNGFRHDYGLAGKTGTTDDYRDSWFAGFSGNYLTVVWVGRDDNQPTGLTGASGAARIWSKSMQQMPLQRLELPYHEDVVAQRVYYSLDFAQQDCSLSRQLPMLVASLPLESLPCAELMQYDPNDDEKKHFQPLPRKQQKKSFWQRIFGQ